MNYRFASLSSGLLARKGAAQPAMATHAGGNPLRMSHEELRRLAPQTPAPLAVEPAPQPQPAIAPVRSAPAPVTVRPAVAFESGPPPFPAAPRPAPVAVKPVDLGCGTGAGCGIADGAAADPARRFHVSVRLRQQHFVRLKIASAQLRKPSQDIVGEALSMYFRSLDPAVFGDCACAREA